MSPSPEKRERLAYTRQVGHCRDRGIALEFSFDEWRSWWLEKLGTDWMGLRGRTKGKYQMGRIGDVGPYSKKNCICITVSKNSADGASANIGEKNGSARLTASQVTEARRIYVPGSKNFGVCALARRYDVAHGTMGPLLHGKTWKAA